MIEVQEDKEKDEHFVPIGPRGSAGNTVAATGNRTGEEFEL
jgi:hypothetical protein